MLKNLESSVKLNKVSSSTDFFVLKQIMYKTQIVTEGISFKEFEVRFCARFWCQHGTTHCLGSVMFGILKSACNTRITPMC